MDNVLTYLTAVGGSQSLNDIVLEHRQWGFKNMLRGMCNIWPGQDRAGRAGTVQGQSGQPLGPQ